MRHDGPFGSAQEIQALQRRSAFIDLWSQIDGLARTSKVRSLFSLARAFFAGAIFFEWVSGIHASGFPSPVPFSCLSRQTKYVMMTFALAVLSLAARIRQSVRRAKLSGALDAYRIADPASESPDTCAKNPSDPTSVPAVRLPDPKNLVASDVGSAIRHASNAPDSFARRTNCRMRPANDSTASANVMMTYWVCRDEQENGTGDGKPDAWIPLTHSRKMPPAKNARANENELLSSLV
ncbi:hypothetical protein ISCGN_008922 [Ixodes scapularis]